MKFSGVLTNDRSYIHWKGWGHRSKVKVMEVKTYLSRFQTVTPAWICGWLWNDAQSLKQHRRGALLFFKVICHISGSHGTTNCRFWPKFSFSRLWLHFEFTDGYEMMHKASNSIEEVPYCFLRSSIKFQGHTGHKNCPFWPNLSISGL